MLPTTVQKVIQSKFKEAEADKERADLYDTDYWACICFGSREQLVEFMDLININHEHKYIDGKDFAEAIGIFLKESKIKWPARTSSTLSVKDIDELAKPLPVGRSAGRSA